jgi:hypothetical protein
MVRIRLPPAESQERTCVLCIKETAFSHRDALCEWGCDAVWLDPDEDAANIRWAREVRR